MESKIIESLLPHLNHWGYYVLFLMTFLETSAFLGFLVPGESMVVIAGLLASRGVLELGDVIWVASLGAIMGDTAGYFIGRRFGEGFFLKYGKYFFFKKSILMKQRDFLISTEERQFFRPIHGMAQGLCPGCCRNFKDALSEVSLFNVAGGIVWAASIFINRLFCWK